MRIIVRFLTLLLCTLDTSAAPSEVLPSDLAVTMTAEPDEGLLPHQIVEVTITVTNRGPESVSAPALYSSYFSDEFALDLASNDCGLGFAVLDGDSEWFYTYIWYSYGRPPLDAGKSQICHLKLPLSFIAPREVAFTFQLSDNYIDPDPSNDSTTIYLRQVVAPIPSDSWPSRTILVSLLVAAAWFAVMKRHRA